MIVSVANLKGGTGKTTVSVVLGVAAAQAGLRVLLIDIDPQASLTSMFFKGFDFDPAETFLSRLASAAYNPRTRFKVFKVCDESGGACVNVAPSHPDIYKTWFTMHQFAFASTALRSIVSGLRDKYDLVVIDSPPDPVLTAQAIRVDAIVVPVDTTPLGAYTGAKFLDMLLDVARSDHTIGRVAAVIANKVDYRGGEPSKEDVKRLTRVIDAALRVYNAGLGMEPLSHGVYAYIPKSEQLLGDMSIFGRRVAGVKAFQAVSRLLERYKLLRDRILSLVNKLSGG